MQLHSGGTTAVINKVVMHLGGQPPGIDLVFGIVVTSGLPCVGFNKPCCSFLKLSIADASRIHGPHCVDALRRIRSSGHTESFELKEIVR